jgi:hypothetical protein
VLRYSHPTCNLLQFSLKMTEPSAVIGLDAKLPCDGDSVKKFSNLRSTSSLLEGQEENQS